VGAGSYCDWSHVAFPPNHAYTATTAWTPLGLTSSSPGPQGWPTPQTDSILNPNTTYCARVLARSDDDAQSNPVLSDWTYLNAGDNPNQPAFFYKAPPPIATQTQNFSPTTPASAYTAPANGAAEVRTPVLTWNWLPGAQGYFVVISRDAGFTDVADVGFTNVPAYAPRLQNGEPLADKNTAYYWAVIPAPNSDGSGSGGDPIIDNPQTFDKSSVPPVLDEPADGADVSTWPTFTWEGAENARNYRLQVSQDPSFGNLLDDITTDATAYTSSTTYPAGTPLYWRVRANDWTGQGLNWSPVRTFVRSLPTAAPSAGNPSSGDGLPVESWSAVPGAIAYDVHIDNGNGLSTDTTVDSPAFAATQRYGIGGIHWQVRPLFPTINFTPVGGGFFPPQPFLLTLGPPTGARGVKSGSRFVVSWSPDAAAKQYEVDVSTTDSFSTTIDSHRVDGTSWAPDIDWSLPANGGRLYWRVAAIDSMGTVGSFATGSFGRGPHAKKHHRKTKRRKHH
jgi:hypothetical protein